VANKLVVRVECDRCHAVSYAEYTEGQVLPIAPSLELHLDNPGDPDGSRIGSFPVLCEGCATAVKNYVNSILKVKKAEVVEEAPKPPPRLERQGRDRGISGGG
jgi:hypothetical protein